MESEFIEPKRLPQTPTSFPPGSLGKLLVMRERLENGEHIHHEHDCKLTLPSTGGRRVSVTLSQDQRI